MPFWRKSEDPWDMEPEKRRTRTAGETQPPAADGEAWKAWKARGRRRQRRSRRRLP